MNAWLTVGPVVSLGSFALAFCAFRITRRNATRERRSDARHEALELAEVRGQVIVDLEKRITEVESNSRHELEKANEKIELLDKVMEHQRKDAAETQRLLVINFRAALLKLLSHLEADPAEVDAAVDYIRDALNGDSPTPSRKRRRAA